MMNLPERREMRISDAERDNVASILRHAAGEGRLDLEELDERRNAVYAAKTYGDLEPIIRDLPSAPYGDRFGGAPTSTALLGAPPRFLFSWPAGLSRNLRSTDCG